MKVRILDYAQLIPTLSEEVKDFFSRPGNLASVPLSVTVAATHSGKRTRNNTFYLPDKMKGSTGTWISDYQKPILVHHNSHKDPIGRAADARYIDTSGVTSIHDSDDLQKFVRGEMSLQDATAFAHLLTHDEKVSEEGLGYIALKCSITDPDSKEKILDGRYMTGSVSATSDAAICSICNIDWAKDSMCDHMPGNEYDGKICFLIAGNFTYEEYSFVNTPADTLSRIIRIGDSVIEPTGNVHSLKSVIIFDSIKEQHHMLTRDQILSIIGSKVYRKYAEELADELMKEVKEETTEEDITGKLDSLIDPVRSFWGEDYEEIVGDDSWGRDYAVMMYGLVEDAKPEEIEIAIKLARDAKLSAKQRKSMKSSSFCGPEKSFPVPDCVHVTAARRLVGKYKGPGDKSKILACVNRKAKRMGCDKTRDDFVFDAEWFDRLEDDQLIQLHTSIHEAATERELEITDSQEELSDLQESVDQLQNQLVDEKKKTHQLVIEKIIDRRLLSGDKIERATVTSEMSGMSIEDLTSIIDKYNSVDISTLSEKLNSGIRIPEEKVTDPTLQTEVDKMTDKQKENLQAWILQKFIELRFRSQQVAEDFLRKMDQQGLVLQSTLDKIGAK